MATKKTTTTKKAASIPVSELKGQIELLKQERDQNAFAAQKIFAVTQSLNHRMGSINNVLTVTNLNHPTNWLSKVWWVIKNLDVIVAAIKAIVEQVKGWEEDMKVLAPNGQINLTDEVPKETK